jgi:hypothetical protein
VSWVALLTLDVELDLLTKLLSDFEAGVSPQTAKPRNDPVPLKCECQGESKNSSVQKELRSMRMTNHNMVIASLNAT